MRVLFINCVSDTPETNLYLGLHAAGVDLSIILDPRDTAADLLLSAGIPVIQATIRHRFDLRFDRTLKKVLFDFSPDVIHAPTSRGLAAALRVTRKSSCKVVTYRGTLGNLSRYSLTARLAHLHPRVDRILCNCYAVRDFLTEMGVASSRLSVIYKGHNPAWYQVTDPLLRQELGIEDQAFVVGCFANIRPLKGVDILVRAIEALENSERSIVCLLVGDSRDKHLEQYVLEKNLSDRVRFLGFRRDVYRILPLCDVTVMPSVRREGFPRAIVESLSNSIPVVCSSVGGMPELVVHQKSGLVVAPGDVQQLAEALRSICDQPEHWKSAGRWGQDFVKENLSLEQYISKTIEVYEQLTDPRDDPGSPLRSS